MICIDILLKKFQIWGLRMTNMFLFKKKKLNKLLLTSLLTQPCQKPLFLGQRRNLRKQYVFYPVNDQQKIYMQLADECKLFVVSDDSLITSRNLKQLVEIEMLFSSVGFSVWRGSIIVGFIITYSSIPFGFVHSINLFDKKGGTYL